jgi:tRNA (cytidine/uridine-2'-O-)-methyltransferase
LERYAEDAYGIPTCGGVRSLNLANAVSIVVYEAMRQVGALDKPYLEGDEGTDFTR